MTAPRTQCRTRNPPGALPLQTRASDVCSSRSCSSHSESHSASAERAGVRRPAHDQLAAGTLRRARAELVDNRVAVDAVEGRHIQDLQAIQHYFKADAAERQRLAFPFSGTHPAFLQYAAWDVAVATQSIQFLKRDAEGIDRQVGYAIQIVEVDGCDARCHAGDVRNRGPDSVGPSAQRYASFAVYFGDCTVIEPRLKHELDTVIEHGLISEHCLTPTGNDQRSALP